jgi:hypothetical protein
LSNPANGAGARPLSSSGSGASAAKGQGRVGSVSVRNAVVRAANRSFVSVVRAQTNRLVDIAMVRHVAEMIGQAPSKSSKTDRMRPRACTRSAACA